MLRVDKKDVHTCHEASDNKFNGQHLTFFHDGDVWVWNGKQGIWNDMLCMLHPPCACLIQNLPLQKYVSHGRYAAASLPCAPASQIDLEISKTASKYGLTAFDDVQHFQGPP